MKIPQIPATLGLLYMLRGLRKGRWSVLTMGMFLILYRLVTGEQRSGKGSPVLYLAPGESVGLRIIRRR